MRLPIFCAALLFVSCENNTQCYEKPDPEQFQSIAGAWDYAGFSEGEVNDIHCFDTTGVSAHTSEFSFTSDGFHYTGVENGYSYIERYHISDDKTGLTILPLDTTQDHTRIELSIAKLTNDELVLISKRASPASKPYSIYYRRIHH